jgi:hypothetical protein
MPGRINIENNSKALDELLGFEDLNAYLDNEDDDDDNVSVLVLFPMNSIILRMLKTSIMNIL